MTDRLYVVGNSHVWTILGWDEFAGHWESMRIDTYDEERDLELVGLAVTGATAHNLVEGSSSTRAGTKVCDFLDGASDECKTVLFVYGDVDCRRHIKGPEMLDATLERYRNFLREIADRPDVFQIIVASVTGFHGVLPHDLVREWNKRLELICEDERWVYLDLYTDFADVRARDENHFVPEARGRILDAIRTRTQTPQVLPRQLVTLSESEVNALRCLLDRERTARESHGGLCGLLSMHGPEGVALMDLLRRI